MGLLELVSRPIGQGNELMRTEECTCAFGVPVSIGPWEHTLAEVSRRGLMRFVLMLGSEEYRSGHMDTGADGGEVV